MVAPMATGLLPTFGGSALDLHLTLSAPGDTRLGIAVNGRLLEGFVVNSEPQPRADEVASLLTSKR